MIVTASVVRAVKAREIIGLVISKKLPLKVVFFYLKENNTTFSVPIQCCQIVGKSQNCGKSLLDWEFIMGIGVMRKNVGILNIISPGRVITFLQEILF